MGTETTKAWGDRRRAVQRCLEDGERRTVDLPPMKPDQIEYLKTVQTAVSDYDPNTIIRGRKPPLERAE